MPRFFPHHPIDIKLEEPAAFRRLSFSLVEMALVTGVTLRLFRALVLTHGSTSWLYLGGTIALGLLLLIGMTTAHLANFTVRQWSWRAPAFGALEAAGEMATSALLIALGREPLGTGRASFSDWPGVAMETLVWRLAVVSVWALLLAGIVQLVRTIVARRMRRTHSESRHGH
jgi:hypothetical protein